MSMKCSPTAQAGLAASRASPASGTGSAPSQPGGFASLLQGLGDPGVSASTTGSAQTSSQPQDPSAVDPALTAPAQDSTNDASAPDALASPQRKATAADGVAGTNTVPAASTPPTSADAAAQVLAQGIVTDNAAQVLLAQFLGLAGAQSAQNITQATTAGSVSSLPHPELARMQPTLTAAPSPAGTVPSANARVAAATASAAQSWAGTPLPQTAPDASLSVAAQHAGATRWVPPGNEQDQTPWQSTVPSAAAATGAQPGAASVRDGAADATPQTLSGLTQTSSGSSVVSALVASEVGGYGRRRNSASVASEPTGVAGPASATLTGSTSSAVITSGTSATGQPAEQAVAEQVKYWISNDVHNAQLKFSGLGTESVQVNISMSGNQAQVVFRSDQAQTREMLGNAMTHLDQMLRAEGLTLTSAWVGSSGQQGQFGAASQQAQPSPQVAPVANPVQAVAAPAPVRPQVVTDRALDLFV